MRRSMLIVSTLVVVIAGASAPMSDATTTGFQERGWVPTGPNGGLVHAFAVDPSDSSILYAVSNYNVYRTTNGGEWWVPFNDDPIYISSGLFVSPADGSVLYGDADGGHVWRSADSGRHWIVGYIGWCQSSQILAVDPSDANHLFAWCQTYYGTDEVRESKDGGDSWVAAPVPTATYRFALDPVDGRRVRRISRWPLLDARRWQGVAPVRRTRRPRFRHRRQPRRSVGRCRRGDGRRVVLERRVPDVAVRRRFDVHGCRVRADVVRHRVRLHVRG